MRNLLDLIQEQVLVCDGAMGTMLYSKGVFINRCFDEMNISNPELVREVHLDYVRAGVDIIETNTFGGNRYKLMNHGLADRLRDVNIAGARIARAAAGGEALVAGAIGPLGIRIEPWGKTSIEEARDAFREQTQSLLDGGVDVFILETFSELNEIHAAIQGVRDVSDRPIIAQMTIEDDGDSLEGTPPEIFAKKLDEWGADVIGLNCSVGPQIMLDMIERVSHVTAKKLSAQPNAGKPKNIEGRNIYLCSPEYMASYARKFVQYGVRIIGGCCGTTPEHIQAICAAVRSMEPVSHRAPTAQPGKPRSLAQRETPQSDEGTTRIPVRPTAAKNERSRLAQKLAQNEFVKMVEMLPPTGHDFADALERAKYLNQHGVDVIDVPEGRRAGACMSALSLAVLLEQTAGIETCVHYASIDRNLLGMQADLLGAYALGLRNILLITGESPSTGDYPDASAVFDVDSIGLTNMVFRLNQGVDVGGKSIGTPTRFHIGVVANPGAINFDEELKRFAYKVEAGADFAVTQPVFDVRVLERFIRLVDHSKIPVIAGILPLANYKNAEFMNNEVPGCSVPDLILQRMRQAEAESPERSRAEGIRIAQDILEQVQGMVQGVQVRGPFERHETPVEVLSVLNLKGASR